MKPTERLGFAVVGLGGIAQHAVLPAFANSRRARLVALVSGDRDKARKLARRFGARDCYSYDELGACFENPGVDAVYLASPNGCHMQQTLAAAAARKHILCEKPMATIVADCQAMIHACRQNRVRLMIAYRKYFEPGSLALKKLVSEGRLGRLRVMHSAFTIMLGPGKAEGWRFDPALSGGGALPDLGIYSINTARWVTRLDPVEAEAHAWITGGSRFNAEIDEHIAFRLSFPGGLELQATASFGADKSSFFRVNGERGWASLDPAFAWDDERRLFGQFHPAGAGRARTRRWFERRFPVIDEFALEIDAFADCIRRGRDPEPDGVQGMRDVAVIEAIYRAAREGHPVPVSLQQ